MSGSVSGGAVKPPRMWCVGCGGMLQDPEGLPEQEELRFVF